MNQPPDDPQPGSPLPPPSTPSSPDRRRPERAILGMVLLLAAGANFKRDLLRSALLQAEGNQTRAAEALGLQRTYLSRLLRELGLRDG